MLAGGYPGDGCWREVSRDVGDAAPYGLPGMGGSGSLPLIRPCGATFPQGGRQGLYGVCGSLRGASGTPPPTGCPGMGGNGRSRRGGGTPPYGWGYGNTVGLTRAAVPGPPFPGRRTVGAGHARPGGLRRQASMVRSVGRGLDPSAGCWRQRESPRVATRGRAAAQAFAGRRGRRPLRFAREWVVTEACPSSGPAGPPSPEGEGKGCMAAAGAAPYPGSWSSVRSWRVRL